MSSLSKILPKDHSKRQWLSILITLLISVPLTLLGIYGIGEYGLSLFVLTPFLIGFCPVIIYGQKKEISIKEALTISFLTLFIFAVGLFVFAIEGLICLAMAIPIAAVITLVGSLAGWTVLNYKKNSSTLNIIILIVSIPLTAFIEKDNKVRTVSVTTSIEIIASPSTVWNNVIQFPELKEPTEFLFNYGISYPINAKIDGTGVGAIRHCNFTTGSFVEPITIWDEPKLLQFSVDECPPPMSELSFWDIDAPHLHDFFVSKKGQFKLTELPNGNTLLEGTTWYTHKIKPEFYWQPWSNYIIHKIHNRVLIHIKENSEV